MSTKYNYRARFEALIEGLRQHPNLLDLRAELGEPTDPEAIEEARALVGKAWPEGLTEFFQELSFVEISFKASSTNPKGEPRDVYGTISIPNVTSMFDYENLEDEIYFDFMEGDHPFHLIRPLDRFVPEAYVVLYPIHKDVEKNTKPAHIAYHYCGEELWDTDLSFTDYIDFLMLSRGIHYGIKLKVGPRDRYTWVEEMQDTTQKLFPDFDPKVLATKRKRTEIPT